MLEPFEICSIRPPTENFSLTFRLTRNCGWNRCLFCPVYKQGMKFSRRKMDEIMKDVDRAKAIDDLIMQAMVDATGRDIFQVAGDLVRQIQRYGGKADQPPLETSPEEDANGSGNGFSSWFKDKPTIIEDGTITAVSKGLHLYEYTFGFALQRLRRDAPAAGP